MDRAKARLARVVVPGLPHHVTQRGNRREPVFFSDDDHRAYLDLIAAARYVAMNPVRAGLVGQARGWPWSSARAHLSGVDDGVVAVAPLLERIGDFSALLKGDADEDAVSAIRRAYSTGRPVGAPDWIKDLEAQTQRTLAPAKRGPKPSREPSDRQDDLFRTVSP